METSLLQIPFLLADQRARLPRRAYSTDAALDFFCIEATRVPPGEIVELRFGLKVAIPLGFCLKLRSRSCYAIRGLLVLSGLIDAGYRGELSAFVYLLPKQAGAAQSSIDIWPGDRVVQGLIESVPIAYPVEVRELPNPPGGERGEGGFGSTG